MSNQVSATQLIQVSKMPPINEFTPNFDKSTHVVLLISYLILEFDVKDIYRVSLHENIVPKISIYSSS